MRTMTEICRTPPNIRYLGKEMFKSVYNPPPTPLKYHNIAKNIIHIMSCTCTTCIAVA